MNNRLKSPAVWMPLAIAIALVAGMWIGKTFMNGGGSWSSRAKLDTILELIEENYVDDIDTDSLLEATLPDLMAALDPHSVYIPAEDLQSVNEELEGSFSGIGISFNLLGDTINVLEVISGGPSEKVGLMPGDRIISVDDSIVAGKGISDIKVKNMLRGPKGSVVSLGIRRPTSKELLTFDVTRGDIPVSSIDAAYMIEPNVGYLKINKFGANTFSEFLTSMITLTAEGAEKFIIDLRGNGGGFMEHAVLMANEFLDADLPIVSMKGAHTPETPATGSDGSGSFRDREVVVLLDEISASASEIFAGALQDNDRGLIVGRRSFGKGLVQRPFPFPDGSMIRLTVSRYYTPAGRCIQKPYTDGDDSDYQHDMMHRYESGELTSADSIHFADSLRCTTLRLGRTVYGGGGIMPDIFVPIDTTMYSVYYRDLVARGVLNRYCMQYVDENRKALQTSYRDEDAFVSGFEVTPDMLGALRSMADADSIAYDSTQYARSLPLIERNVKGLIGRDLFSQATYYRVVNPLNPIFNRAVQVATDPEEYDKYLPRKAHIR